ncbi:MAG TPA: SHOCT domain-containing protein [Candidatus Angelobacter sp.]|nr:SHOCT domain-containing protein [Candidatus Angelobacter sp.]
MRKLYSVLTLWCVLLLAPGVYEAFGNVTLNGTLAGLWIVGYLAQFGVFMWIMNLVGDQKVLWWFIASLLPWVVDWSVPTSPWFLLLCAAVAVAVAFWIGHSTQRAQSLQERGIRATGVVLEVLKPWMNVVINNVYIRRRLRLRIQRQDGTPAYEGILKGLFMLGEIPSVGDRLALRVDPANPQHFDYDKDSTEKAQTASARVSDFGEGRSSDARLSGEHLSHEHLSDELARLADLHKRGALTDSEFAAAKKKLLR